MSKDEPSPLGQAAEDYARSGWHIFPVKPRDKTPLTPHGLKDATSRLDVVRSWWARWPDANIGLNCGKSQMVVVDLDKRGEFDGLAEWADLLTRLGLTLSTSTSLTGGGGRHLLFKTPAGVSIKNSAGKLAPGIDVRGEGGYVVLPPSIHPSGKSYAWESGADTIEVLPDPVVQILTAEPDPWKVYTLQDALLPRAPVVWTVAGVLPEGSLSIWYGAPGTLKSLLLADMCMCVAAGHPWLVSPQGGGGLATAAGPVMWLDFDNGARRTHERFGALARGHNAAGAPLYYVSMPDPYLDAGDTESMAALANRVIGRDITLVVIDNLGVVSGNADENSAEMQRPMGGLRWLAETTGAAVVVLHHQRKTNGLNARAGETLRGHGSIEAGIDLGVQVSRDGQNLTLLATKVRGPDIQPFGATFSYENDEHHELVTARFWPFDPNAEGAHEQAQLEQDIVEFLTRFPGSSANRVWGDVGGNKQHVLDTLRQMEKAGLIQRRPGAGTASLLFVP